MLDVSLIGAFLGGLIVFFSPCVLPIVPFYLSYMAGASMQEIVDSVTRGGASTCGTEIVYRVGVTSIEARVRELDPTPLLTFASTDHHLTTKQSLHPHPPQSHTTQQLFQPPPVHQTHGSTLYLTQQKAHQKP